MRALIILLFGCVVCSICSCIADAPYDKYPYGRQEVIREHEEYWEGKDRE
jgi:hypothetical protein